jgi:hypothetical protein
MGGPFIYHDVAYGPFDNSVEKRNQPEKTQKGRKINEAFC